MELKISHIKEAIDRANPITFRMNILSAEILVKLEKVLSFFLAELGLANITDQLVFCLRELVENARKANLKRIYFKESKLDITNPADYEKGMKSFREDVFSRIQTFLPKLQDHNLYMKVSFHANSSFFTIVIRNNSLITDYELKRIEDRIARSQAFKSMEEAFTMLDMTEGAGLGIVILVLMLKKIGLSEASFKIETEGAETVATLQVPRSDIIIESIDEITAKVVAELTTLPQFPEHITVLRHLISNPNSDISEIARVVQTDPALTAELIRLVNSAAFMLPKKIHNIPEAIKLVGLKGLSNLLISYGSQKILQDKYGEMKELWDHSYKTAFYAYTLAINHKKSNIRDDIYVSSLLHDLGKVVVNFLHPELLERIRTFTAQKGIPAKLFEEFSIGLHHAEIGSRIATRWNFSDSLISAIRYHHEPENCQPQHKDLVEIIYLANSLCNLEDDYLTFEQMNPVILQRYGFDDRENLDIFHNTLQNKFFKEQKDSLIL